MSIKGVGMQKVVNRDYSLFRGRRARMHALLSEQSQAKNGVVVMFADFEAERRVFRQESSFYYLTGVLEPGAVLFSYQNGRDVLYLPNYGGQRDQWLNVEIAATTDYATHYNVDEIKHVGGVLRGYSISPYFTQADYEQVMQDLQGVVGSGGHVYTLLDQGGSNYVAQHHVVERLCQWNSSFKPALKDVSPIVHSLRQTKDSIEIETIHQAVRITTMAHEVAAASIKPGVSEREVQAQIEHVYTVMGATNAFPSIVAGGKNTTVLHYVDRDQVLKEGDLVVIDIGAEYGYYAADLTRTYPVSGTFTDRQKEIYDLVLATQAYVESKTAPGMYLRNAHMPEKSLHHLAVEYLEKAGYSKYFMHGIGHYLGLDVHDAGDYFRPLKAGDVITIEPGIYIREESLGVRIEDNYVVTDNGCACLSMDLPRTSDEIEKAMTQGI
jgi:Xaa-Pro aminopeptidase